MTDKESPFASTVAWIAERIKTEPVAWLNFYPAKQSEWALSWEKDPKAAAHTPLYHHQKECSQDCRQGRDCDCGKEFK
jgi:hypothetical protein